ncbi:MAG: hypothetical protein Nk1A_7080 [Endomicrobiia bacterium]|nr:MAG: hypothetical protein Nk1A_7080 [Endomicrobiia bacterium]
MKKLFLTLAVCFAFVAVSSVGFFPQSSVYANDENKGSVYANDENKNEESVVCFDENGDCDTCRRTGDPDACRRCAARERGEL